MDNAPSKQKPAKYEIEMIGIGSDPSRDVFKDMDELSLKYHVPKEMLRDLPQVGQTKKYVQDFGDGEKIEYRLTRKNTTKDNEMDTAKLNELKKKVLKSEAPAKVKLAAVKALDARCNADEPKENATYDQLEQKIVALQKELDKKREAWQKESARIETEIDRLVSEQRKLEK